MRALLKKTINTSASMVSASSTKLSRLAKLDQDSPMVGMRWHLLRALKSLAQGHRIYILGPFSYEMHLEGCATVATLINYLIREKIIEECPDEHWAASAVFKITERGQRMYQSGQAWWDSLSLTQRLALVVLE